MKPKNVKRCAIYTRKSSEEGLDQAFNSLDAQREACEAYIKSQQHEGWIGSKEHYDDGGFSGGNLKRPALSDLIEKIKLKLIDIIVVYKVDRLSRSLADFAKLVELFDEHEVSFVSVTQQFNTSSSMGRLTLNVLLSFAQFEREVTGERIRDKIAASKKKGMWMGGNIPLGYQTKDRKLIIDKKNTKLVQHIFNQYITYQSVRLLKQHLDEKNIRSRQGNLFSPGMLYKLLQNPHYIGKIRHKEKTYEGEHTPIIDLNIWKQAQSILHLNRNNHQTRKYAKSKSPLAGILFDDRGNYMSPSHTNKNNKRHRYYVSQALIQHRDHEAGSIARVNAEEVETAVFEAIKDLLSDSQKVLEVIGYEKPELSLIKAIANHVKKLLKDENNNSIQNKLLQPIQKIVVKKDQLILQIYPEQLAILFGLDVIKRDPYIHTQDIQWQRLGKGQTLILNGKSIVTDSSSKRSLQKAVVKALEWNQGLLDGSFKSLSEIANNEGVVVSYVRRILRLAFLSPELLKAILLGSSSVNLELEKSKAMIPFDWKFVKALK
jgi:DNA invertase Pin-like site-specific DNA recombinase